jgi:hypothetical protein
MVRLLLNVFEQGDEIKIAPNMLKHLISMVQSILKEKHYVMGKVIGLKSDKTALKSYKSPRANGFFKEQWDHNIMALESYKKKHADEMWDGHVPAIFQTTDDPPSNLGTWVRTQRQAKKKGSLRKDHMEQLNSIGLKWEGDNNWDPSNIALLNYKKKHGYSGNTLYTVFAPMCEYVGLS